MQNDWEVLLISQKLPPSKLPPENRPLFPEKIVPCKNSPPWETYP